MIVTNEMPNTFCMRYMSYKPDAIVQNEILRSYADNVEARLVSFLMSGG